MQSVVVDSSVALKWFVPEVLTDQAVSLLDAGGELLAPDLLFPVAGNILWKKVGRGEIEPRDARDLWPPSAACPSRWSRRGSWSRRPWR